MFLDELYGHPDYNLDLRNGQNQNNTLKNHILFSRSSCEYHWLLWTRFLHTTANVTANSCWIFHQITFVREMIPFPNSSSENPRKNYGSAGSSPSWSNQVWQQKQGNIRIWELLCQEGWGWWGRELVGNTTGEWLQFTIIYLVFYKELENRSLKILNINDKCWK
jgi:hypothetical protein